MSKSKSKSKSSDEKTCVHFKPQRAEHKNLADTMLYTTEKMLKDAGDKVTADEKK